MANSEVARSNALRRRTAILVAAVAVAGLLSAAPAFAAAITLSAGATVTSTPNGATAAPAPAGSAITANLSITLSAAATGTNSISASYTIVNPNGTDVTSSAAFSANATPDTNTTTAVAGAAYTLGFNNNASTAAHTIGAVTFTPAVGGAYRVRVTTANIGTPVDAFTHLMSSTVITIYVYGNNVTLASSGIGTQSGTAVAGSNARIDVNFPAHPASQTYLVTATGMLIASAVDGPLAAPTTSTPYSGADYTNGVLVTMPANTNAADTIFTLTTATAGTGTLSITIINSGTPSTISAATITWSPAPAFSPAYSSTTFYRQGSAAQAIPNGPVIIRGTTPNLLVASSTITINDASGSPLNGQTVNAYIIGPGTLAFTAGAATRGRVLAQIFTSNTGQLNVYTDGNPGNTSVVISVGPTTLATYQLTLFGDVTTLSATSVLRQFPVGNNVGTISLAANDKYGNPVPDAILTATTSDPSVASIQQGGFTGVVYPYTVSTLKAGMTTITFTESKGAIGTFSLSVNESIIRILTLTLDKATYAPNENATLTLTAKNADGSYVADGNYNIFTSALSAPAVSAIPAFLGGVVTISSGAATYNFVTPFVAGDFTVTGTISSDPKVAAALQGSTVSAKATVKTVIAKPTPTPTPTPTSLPGSTGFSATAIAAAIAQLATTIATLITSLTAQLTELSLALIRTQQGH